MRRYIVIGVFGLLFVLGVYWLATHAFLVVSIPDASGKPVSVSITRQGSDKTISLETTTGSIKKLLPRGDYEITAQNGRDNSLAIVKTGRFLGTKTVEASLQTQKQRQFVGDNPSPCMAYGQELFSYTCSGALADVNYHAPARSNAPTMVEKSYAEREGTMQGTITLDNEVVALVKTSQDTYAHNLFALSGGKIRRIADLTQLSDRKSYQIKPARGGFVVYSNNFDEAYFYSSPTATPQSINLGKVTNKDMVTESIEVGGNMVVVVSAENDRIETQRFDEAASTSGKTEVVVNINGVVRNYTFPNYYRSVKPCGDNTLCMLNGRLVTVYDVSGKKAKQLYRIENVQAIDVAGDSLIATRQRDVLQMNARSGSGFVSFYYGEYTFCGLQINQTSYTLCLITSKQRKVGVVVDIAQNGVDFPENKLAELLKVTGTTMVSLYKDRVYIVPDSGPAVYDKKTKGFVRDKAVTRVVIERLKSSLQSIGLTPPNYTTTILHDD